MNVGRDDDVAVRVGLRRIVRSRVRTILLLTFLIVCDHDGGLVRVVVFVRGGVGGVGGGGTAERLATDADRTGLADARTNRRRKIIVRLQTLKALKLQHAGHGGGVRVRRRWTKRISLAHGRVGFTVAHLQAHRTSNLRTAVHLSCDFLTRMSVSVVLPCVVQVRRPSSSPSIRQPLAVGQLVTDARCPSLIP